MLAEKMIVDPYFRWHGTILAKLALVPQRIMNAYPRDNEAGSNKESMYQEGDFIAAFPTCIDDRKNSCEEDMASWFGKAQEKSNS